MGAWLRPYGLVGIAGLAVEGLAWACSCLPPAAVPDALEEADQVFFAEVESVRAAHPLGCLDGTVSSADPMRVRLAVREGFVGAAAGDVVEVETARDGASCGVDFAEGETWLVYATGGTVSLCSRTRPASEGDPELDELAEQVR